MTRCPDERVVNPITVPSGCCPTHHNLDVNHDDDDDDDGAGDDGII